MEQLLTPEQAAELLNVSEDAVQRWLRNGQLIGSKIGRDWRIKREDLQKFIDERRNKPKE